MIVCWNNFLLVSFAYIPCLVGNWNCLLTIYSKSKLLLFSLQSQRTVCLGYTRINAQLCLLTDLKMVELVSLNIVVDRHEHGWADQREHCFWQAWTWLSWPAWTVFLIGLNMVQLVSLNSVVDRLVHACWNRVFMAWWTNRLEQRCWNHHDKQQRCSNMIDKILSV